MLPITLIVAILALFAADAVAEPPASPVKSSVTPCLEDEDCWRWPTMGNLQRGVVLNTPKGEPKRSAVLEPCEFAFYDFRGWIDWKRTPRLPGDQFARAHGCNPRLFA